MSRLNYRVFQANVILKSYHDTKINMFDSSSLFSKLTHFAEDRDMSPFIGALYFKRPIVVKDTYCTSKLQERWGKIALFDRLNFSLLIASCFLLPDELDDGKMYLLILCRTRGQNLSELIFPGNSKVAMYILDKIVFEAAGMLYKELKFASEHLRRDRLWSLFSTTGPSAQPGGEQNFAELLQMIHRRPIAQLLGMNDATSVQYISLLNAQETLVDWTACCSMMRSDPAFSPNWVLSFDTTHGVEVQVFYLPPEDMFLMVGLDRMGQPAFVDLLEKEQSITLERPHMAIQKLTNFLLHYIWSELK